VRENRVQTSYFISVFFLSFFSTTPVDSLPESATCSHTLFLPTYTR